MTQDQFEKHRRQWYEYSRQFWEAEFSRLKEEITTGACYVSYDQLKVLRRRKKIANQKRKYYKNILKQYENKPTHPHKSGGT